MLIDWLIRTTLELSLLIGLVLVLRPLVRRAFGARAAYWLWCIPLLRAVLIDRPERPQLVIESLGPATGGFDVFPLPASLSALSVSGTIFPGTIFSISWAAVWIAGLSLWLALKLLAWLRFRAALGAGAVPIDPPVAGRVRFVVCDLPGTPFVTGLVRPRVCLPPDFTQRFDARQQSWIIQHELMHVARHDLWMQFAWEMLRAAFWFNPLVHIAARALRHDQELACDQAIVGHCDADARWHYGKTLIASAGAYPQPVSIPFFGKHRERIAMIARHRASKIRHGIGIALCAALGACALTSPPPPVIQAGTGDPITLNFVDLDLRAVLQLLAEFSGSNIVVSDQIPQANVTMSARSVPWDEVLARLVSCVGAELGPNSGNVIVIRPSADGPGRCDDIEISGRPI